MTREAILKLLAEFWLLLPLPSISKDSILTRTQSKICAKQSKINLTNGSKKWSYRNIQLGKLHSRLPIMVATISKMHKKKRNLNVCSLFNHSHIRNDKYGRRQEIEQFVDFSEQNKAWNLTHHQQPSFGFEWWMNCFCFLFVAVLIKITNDVPSDNSFLRF